MSTIDNAIKSGDIKEVVRLMEEGDCSLIEDIEFVCIYVALLDGLVDRLLNMRWNDISITVDILVRKAVNANNHELVVKMVQRGVCDPTHVACMAAEKGMKETVLEISKMCDVKWGRLAHYIARSGDVDLLSHAIDKGANDWNFIAYGAALGGHITILKDMIQRGADDWEYMLKYAEAGGHKEVISSILA